MKTKDNLYIKILLWAYDKAQEGFTREELNTKFNLRGELHQWVESNFFNGTNSNRALIGHLRYSEGIQYFTLSSKGMSAVIDYIELKEARESSQKAIKIATWSFGVAIGIGILQILVQLC